MSVVFYSCDRCGSTFPDCGPYVHCQDDCSRRWCDHACARADGWRHGDDDDYEYGECSCKFCRAEDMTDGGLLAFLLKHLGWTREQAVEAALAAGPKD